MGILGELWVKLGLKNEGLNKGLEQSKQKVDGFAQYMGKLGGIMATAFSIKEIVAFTNRAAELANKAAGVRKAFDALNKPNLLADLRRATMGTVDDLQLMQRAVQAKNFKIPLDQLATYLQFATKRANETGQSVDYLVDSIITGLGRQSTLILDNLGISAAEIRDNMKDGASMADAVGKIIKEQMGDAVTEIDNAALATGRLTAAWTNFQIAAGESSPWNAIKQTTAALLENATSFMTNAPAWKKWMAALFPVLGAGFAVSSETKPESTATGAQGGGTTTEETKKETKALIPLIQKRKDEIELLEKRRNLSANETEIRNINDQIAALKEELRLLEMTNAEFAEYQAGQDHSFKPVEGIFDLPKIEANTNAGVEALRRAREAWEQECAEIAAKTKDWQDKVDEAAEAFNQSIVSGISGGVQELARALTDLEGANLGTVIQALLSPMADALIAAGEMIIAEGIAVEAFKSSLRDLDGKRAIVTGAALIAIAAAAKAGLQAIGNNPKGAGGYGNNSVTSYSGGYGVNGNNYAQAAASYTLTTTLKGQDLLLAIQRTQNNNRR